MDWLPGALLVFVLRLTDVSLGTLRTLFVVRGRRTPAVVLGFVESSIFIFAISQVLVGATEPHKMIGYAAGFAGGVFVGITLERWIASGWILARITSRDAITALADRLRAEHFGATVIRGEGREGEIGILFVVTARKRGKELLRLVQEVDPDAFIVMEPVQHPVGGYVPHVADLGGMKK